MISVGLVALVALRAGVPAGDAALRVEQEDRVVAARRSTSSRKRSSLLRSRSSCWRRSVRSRVILENPRSSPFASSSAVMTMFAQKRRAVLAHAPAFVLEATFARGHFEFVLGPALGPAFRRVEHADVLADDLVRR